MPQQSSSSQYNSATPLLDNICSPADLKKLSRSELVCLAEEIRREIIGVVTNNGGHLASSLGAVELILALHYVLDTPKDKIVFDVGHQTYAHKIITGRRAGFGSIRCSGGLSGFPKRAESIFDNFDTGHSSTSISAALGLACARDLAGENFSVAAVIGDGALTGGMALEALNHAGALKKKLLVILNDNNMSISPNVGGLSEYLSLMATTPTYIRLRQGIKHSLGQAMPNHSPNVIGFLGRLEDAIKSLTTPSAWFEALGFKYLGPFDGHDINHLIDGLSGAAALAQPVLFHVVTTKGKGYAPAEENPLGFHGVGQAKGDQPKAGQTKLNQVKLNQVKLNQVPAGPASGFGASDITTFEPDAAPPSAKQRSFSEIFGQVVLELADCDERLVAITAAMSEGTGLAPFFQKYPSRSFDVGIAEQHAVTLAAGLAAGDFRPVVAIYSSFLQRSFDQLYHDVALQNLPVLVAVDRAGLVGEDGPTHHGALDLSYLRLLPNFTVMVPTDARELESMLKLALSLNAPAAIRYPRGGAPCCLPGGGDAPLEVGRGVVVRSGRDVSIFVLGPGLEDALKAAESLAKEGIDTEIINLRFIKPLDEELVRKSAAKTGGVVTVEENLIAGGLFGAVSEVLAADPVPIVPVGLTSALVPQASPKVQREASGLSSQGIHDAVLKLLALKKR